MTPSLDDLNSDFLDLLRALVDSGVEFVVVGAYALSFHGAPRASGDIDIFVKPSPDNAARVWRAFLAFGAPLAAAGVVQSDFEKPDLVYQIGLPPRRVDVLTSISGVSFEEAWSSRAAATVEGRTVHFIGREMYLRNKLAAGRPKDLADAARLSKMRRA
jgi:predicted nucleotidyltransferase